LQAEELYQLAAQKEREEQEAKREANAAEVKRLQQDRKAMLKRHRGIPRSAQGSGHPHGQHRANTGKPQEARPDRIGRPRNVSRRMIALPHRQGGG
jgi:hypothetical protein